LQEIYSKRLFRKISKEESCRIQGFPGDFILPESRSRWMKLVGNSVSVPVISALVAAITETGCFSEPANSMDDVGKTGAGLAKSRAEVRHEEVNRAILA
jgi:hypothetical protein